MKPVFAWRSFANPVTALLLCAASAGCAVDARSIDGDEAVNPEETGSIGLELRVGDVSIDSVTYVITGNGYSKTGSIDVSKSTKISATIAGIPAGNGYSVTLSATGASDAQIVCGGSASFNVTARSTTVTNVKLECKLPGTGNGSVQLNAAANVCPRIDALSVEPAEALVGGTMALKAAVTDSDALPAAAGYAWSATGGSISGANAASATFTCSTAGEFEISLVVSDTQCGDSAKAMVTCTADTATHVPLVKVNEVESNGGTPGDWTELYNADSVPADISGWSFKDNDDTHVHTIPAGTIIPPGGYYVVEEAAQSFGLGSADSARLFTAAGVLVDQYSWTAHATATYGRCANGTGAFGQTSSTKGAANACTPPAPVVKINEVESNGGTPGDWTELYNAGTTPADVSGWSFKDNDDTHNYVLPAGTVIPVGGYYVIEEAAQTFGLGGADSVRLFDATGAAVDSYAWTAHATSTYGRCANGSGVFVQTPSSKGALNSCPVPPGTPVLWPGQNDVKTLDVTTQWTSNLSGLTYEAATSTAPAVLWAVVNGPGTLYRLLWNGTSYLPDTSNDWSAGKGLRYPNGAGNPDSESVTFAASPADGLYVATERNNDASTVSRLAVLRFDAGAPGATLAATHEWNLTSLLPAMGANLGLEAITWVPDSYLVSKGFFDEGAGHAYTPSEHANHGTGLFFVGIEGNGILYAFALDHSSGAATLVATIATGQTGVMSLEFDRETNYLWFGCDDTCANKTGIFTIDQTAGSSTLGRFTLRRLFDRPSTLPDTNNEGIAIAPESECVGGFKSFFWSDDNDKDGFSLRRDSIPCGAFVGL